MMPKVTPDSALIVAGTSGIINVTRGTEKAKFLELTENDGAPLFKDDDNELNTMLKVNIYFFPPFFIKFDSKRTRF